MKDKQSLILMETVWLHSSDDCELYSFFPFLCQLKSCQNIWSSNSSVYGVVPILCTEVVQFRISALPLSTIMNIMTVKWVLSQQLTLFTFLLIPVNLEALAQIPIALDSAWL